MISDALQSKSHLQRGDYPKEPLASVAGTVKCLIFAIIVAILIINICHAFKIFSLVAADMASAGFYCSVFIYIYRLKLLGVTILKKRDVAPIFDKSNLFSLISIPLLVFCHGINSWIAPFGLFNAAHNSSTILREGAGIAAYIQFAMVVAVSPLVEEIVFRRLLLGSLSIKFNPIVSALVVSTIFAAFHLTFGSFAFSVTMCNLYAKEKSLRLPIICHIVNNTIVSLSLIRPKYSAFLSEWLLNDEGVLFVSTLTVIFFNILLWTPRRLRERSACASI